MIDLLGDRSIFNCSSFSSEDYTILGPEDQLQEIVIIAFEAAIEAGLKPAQALAVLEAFAASERDRLQDRIEPSEGAPASLRRKDGKGQVSDGLNAGSVAASTSWVEGKSVARRKQVTDDRIAQSGIGFDR
jgi:hypothetical protein